MGDNSFFLTIYLPSNLVWLNSDGTFTSSLLKAEYDAPEFRDYGSYYLPSELEPSKVYLWKRPRVYKNKAVIR